jgi:hypothetical protein
VIRRPSGRLGHDALEPQNPQVQLVDEHVNHPYRVVVRHVLIQKLRKQDTLPAILTLNETLHLKPRSSGLRILTRKAFSHSLDPTQTWCAYSLWRPLLVARCPRRQQGRTTPLAEVRPWQPRRPNCSWVATVKELSESQITARELADRGATHQPHSPLDFGTHET